MYINKENMQSAIDKNLECKSLKKFGLKKLSFFFLLLSLFYPVNTKAQCAMCRAALETQEGGVSGEAVNDGIIYLMVFPYILVGVLCFAIYRMRSKIKKKPEN